MWEEWLGPRPRRTPGPRTTGLPCTLGAARRTLPRHAASCFSASPSAAVRSAACRGGGLAGGHTSGGQGMSNGCATCASKDLCPTAPQPPQPPLSPAAPAAPASAAQPSAPRRPRLQAGGRRAGAGGRKGRAAAQRRASVGQAGRQAELAGSSRSGPEGPSRLSVAPLTLLGLLLLLAPNHLSRIPLVLHQLGVLDRRHKAERSARSRSGERWRRATAAALPSRQAGRRRHPPTPEPPRSDSPPPAPRRWPCGRAGWRASRRRAAASPTPRAAAPAPPWRAPAGLC